jgi:hypothetical protein
VATSRAETSDIEFKEFPKMPKEVRMQTRLARSWTALRYDLSSQRAVDNASRMLAEHDRLLAEIDALARRIDAALPVESEPSTQRVA